MASMLSNPAATCTAAVPTLFLELTSMSSLSKRSLNISSLSSSTARCNTPSPLLLDELTSTSGLCKSNNTPLLLPALTAISSGVQPERSFRFTASLILPFFKKSSNDVQFRCATAVCKGVNPLSSCVSRADLQVSNFSNRTLSAAQCPRVAAVCSTVSFVSASFTPMHSPSSSLSNNSSNTFIFGVPSLENCARSAVIPA
ncbi:hypothetical protein ABW19_dt0201998 [Dactylella cylindrospora]|nr:hypothetical protein ABW19_dt0201998 [Dactylella cylindrospora]